MTYPNENKGFIDRIRNIPTNLSEMLYGRVQPQARELEEVIIGAMMLEKEAVGIVIGILKPESFYVESHQIICRVIFDLFSKNQPIDILTVVEGLRKSGDIERVGGAFAVSELTNKVGSSANIDYHCYIVYQKFLQRDYIRICSEGIRNSYEDTTDVYQMLDNAVKSLYELTTGISNKKIKGSDRFDSTIKRITEAKGNPSHITGISTGSPDLDKHTGGWQKSDLIVLAGRPGMSKCLGYGTKVIMFDGSLKEVQDIRIGDKVMGVDSMPRNVIYYGCGVEMMYWVKQNQGIDYRVNESHVLSLKRSRNNYGYKNGTRQKNKGSSSDVLNISVSEYIGKSKKFQNNFKGYKVGIEFPEVELQLEPYFMGLWLGDGTSTKPEITTNDIEVVNYLERFAIRIGLKLLPQIEKDKCPRYVIGKGYKGKVSEYSLIGHLRRLGLYDNKHIPVDYLINSRNNRLQLLSGLLDSDGCYFSQGHCFKITQKRRSLAIQIKYLADTLGFKTSFAEVTGEIKSIDFSGKYYSVNIWGDVENIPVKIKRKKPRVPKRNKNWQVTGIEIEKDDIDQYYGFTLDGDGLFLLEDGTVTHNTSVALQWGSAAVNNNKKVLFFSLEMGEHQIAMKELSQYSHVNSWRMRNGFVNDEELKKVINASEILSSRKMFIDDTPAISLQQLRAKAYQLAHNIDGLDMIIIDYMQLMSSPDSKRGNREQELAAISGGLKKLAKELDIPVISLSQLSRKVEERGDKRPLLSDIRESGAIEQDADQVIFLYRDSYYNHSKEDTNGVSEMEFIFAKFRGGETGTIKQWWIPKFTKFIPINNYTKDGTLPKADMDYGSGEPELPTGNETVEDELPF